MDRLPRLVRTVCFALTWREALQRAATWVPFVGLAALLAGGLAPAAPRWPFWIVAGAVVLAGAFLAYARRPSEPDLVLFVDRRLGADAAIVSAWELGQEGRSRGRFDERVRGAAQAALEGADPKAVRPALWTRAAWGLPLGMALLAGASALPVPDPVSVPVADPVTLTAVPALERIESLPEVARTEDERARLEAVAAEAQQLREALSRGLERREALDALERVREGVSAARQPESGVQQRARDAAIDALDDREAELARALALRDQGAFDRGVERAAARREEADRERARQALDEAARAAEREGDDGLARSLLRRRRLLDDRAGAVALVRQLAEAMPELLEGELGRRLERLERGEGGGAELTPELVRAMEQAWSRLTPEERARLAERLRGLGEAENQRAREASEPGAAESLSADEVEAMLRRMLDDLDGVQRQLAGEGGQGLPLPRRGGQPGGGQHGGGQGVGQPGGAQPGGGQGAPGGQAGEGQSGSGRAGQGNAQGGGGAGGAGGGGGPGEPGGETSPRAAGDGPLARVRGEPREGAPGASWLEWVDPEGAPVPTRSGGAGGATGTSAPGESGAIERAPIPEDYRDHVRTYFGGEGAPGGAER